MEFQYHPESDAVENKQDLSKRCDTDQVERVVVVEDKSNIELPPDCLNTVSMPKNWSHVERLKQQRQILHKQLFAQSIKVKNDKNQSGTVNIDKLQYKSDAENDANTSPALKKISGNHYLCKNTASDDELDAYSSDDNMPRLHIAESDTLANDDFIKSVSQDNMSNDYASDCGEIVVDDKTNFEGQSSQNSIKSLHSSEESNENCSQKSLNCSDLCDLSASGINEALHNAISSVNVSKHKDKNRIKQVLQGLKMKAEEKETDTSGYRISKAMATAVKSSTSSNGPSYILASSSSEAKNSSYQNETLESKNENIGSFSTANNLTKYVGLPVKVDNVSKDVDYKNIALQKYLAEKRLSEKDLKNLTLGAKESPPISHPNNNIEGNDVLKNGPCPVDSIKKEPIEQLETDTSHLQVKRRQLEMEKELCQLKLEIFQKRTHKEGPLLQDLKEEILLAKRMFETKKKLLRAEIDLNKYKLMMVQRGIPVFPHMPLDYSDDELTGSEQETDNTDIKKSPDINGKSQKLTHNSSATKDFEKVTKSEDIKQEEDCGQKLNSFTVSDQDGNSHSPTGDKCLPEFLNSTTSSENLNAEESVCVETMAEDHEEKRTELRQSNGKINISTMKGIKKRNRIKPGNTFPPGRKVTVVQSVKNSEDVLKVITVSQAKSPVSTSLPKTQSPPLPKTQSPVSPPFQSFSGANASLKHSPSIGDINSGQSALRVVVPQATVTQCGTKSHLQVSSDNRRPSPRISQSKSQTEKFILPTGLVKDESTNKVFHTYHFAGNTFAMIDNRLYQIHLKNTEGRTRTVIGALMPTMSSVSAQSNMLNPIFSKGSSPASVTASTYTSPSVSTSTVLAAAPKLPNDSVTHRFPVNAATTGAHQPAHLVMIPTTNNCNTIFTKATRNPMINASSGRNNVRSQLYMSLTQNANRMTHKVSNGQMSQLLGVPNPVTKVLSASEINARTKRTTSSPIKLAQPVLFQPVNQQVLQVTPTKGQMIYTTSRLAKSEVSPIAKSLLTSKTYVMVNSAPVMSTTTLNGNILPADVVTPRFEYCGSVIANTSSAQKTSENQTSNKSESIKGKSSVEENSGKFGSRDLDDIENKARRLIEHTFAKPKHEQTSSKIEMEIKEGSKQDIARPEKTSFVEKEEMANTAEFRKNVTTHSHPTDKLPPSSSAKICSSMDSYIYIDKRRMEQTALKVSEQKAISSQKMQNSISSQNSEVQSNFDGLSQNSPINDKDIKTKSKNDSPTEPEKICDPVPFLDYPARIVSLGKNGGNSKMKEIVASPRDKSKSGHSSDTSLDEDKMAKMISFAQMLEEEKKVKELENDKVERKRNFKKRLIDSRKVADRSKMNITDSDSDINVENSAVKRARLLEEEKGISLEISIKDPTENEPANEKEKQGISDITTRDGISTNGNTDRNMFDSLEQLMSGQSSRTESCTESDDPYDSSDLENYENFVSSQTHVPRIIKPKSQFIESFFASNNNGEVNDKTEKVSISETKTPVTSDSCPEKTELNITVTDATKIPDLDKNSSDTAEMKQDSLVSCKSPVKDESGPCGKPNQDASQKVDQNPALTVGSRQVKKFIKTKFIILKGDVCDRWFAIKKKTGFGEMSDPKFIHYLLRLEEERQTKMSQLQAQLETGNDLGAVNSENETGALSTEEVLPDHSFIVDMNNNNNNSASGCKEERECDSFEDEDTLINVTDTPESSPGLPGLSVSAIMYQSERKDAVDQNKNLPEVSDQEKRAADFIHIRPLVTKKTAVKPQTNSPAKPSTKVGSRKRKAGKFEDASIPAAKKPVPFLADATKRQMRWAVSLFREWLKETGEEDIQFEYRDSSWLDDKLSQFYGDALSHEGTPYSTDILQTFRRSLSMYLSSGNNCRNVHISIAHDPEYKESNSVLSGLMLAETRRGTISTQESLCDTITARDMKKLYKSKTLSDSSPTHLLWKVWFDITYHLCKGKLPRNFWRSLTKRSLVLGSDISGVFYMFADYVYLPPDEEPGKMYATPEEPEKCPVRSTSLYLSKLSANCDALFQCSKTCWSQHESWYWPVPMSREKLERIMSQVCAQANLSKVYDVSSVMLTAKQAAEKKM